MIFEQLKEMMEKNAAAMEELSGQLGDLAGEMEDMKDIIRDLPAEFFRQLELYNQQTGKSPQLFSR